MKVNFLDIILFVLFFQLLILVPFLFFQRSPRLLSNRILAFFLLAKALCITNFLAFRLYNYTYEYFPHAFFFGSSFTILWGPLLYLYIRSLTDKDFRLGYRQAAHFIPFLVHFTYLLLIFHILDADSKRRIIQVGGAILPVTWNTFYTMLHVYILVYTCAALLRIRTFKKGFKTSISPYNTVDLNWMHFILFGFLLKWGFDVIFHFADGSSQLAGISLMASRIVLYLFISLMIYKALRQPYILLGRSQEPGTRRQSLSALSKETYLQKLRNHMERDKPYLDPELTFEELSRRVAIPPRSLTTVLNECLNQNFYDFINCYRVQESARLLMEKTPRSRTILEVLFEAGFNNKASFNNAFKKHNGMTPTEFRKLKAS